MRPHHIWEARGRELSRDPARYKRKMRADGERRTHELKTSQRWKGKVGGELIEIVMLERLRHKSSVSESVTLSAPPRVA